MRRGIARHHVLGDGAGREPHAVDADAKLGQADGVGLVAAQHARSAGVFQPLGDDAGGVVVAADAEDANARAGEARGLLGEELAGAPVLPGAVEQIPGDQDEGDALCEGEIDQVGVGGAGGVADALGGGVGVGFEAAQRAVDVQVGGVEESEGRHVSQSSSCSRDTAGQKQKIYINPFP